MRKLLALPLPTAIAMVIIAAILLAAAFAPWVAFYDQADIIGDAWAYPTLQHWLGLDNLGRDMLSRLIYGARATIGIGFVATCCAFTIGVLLGFTAALGGRWVDLVLSRINDACLAIPSMISALVIISVLGNSIIVMISTIAVIYSTRVFRVSRALAMDITVLQYFEAARLRGDSFWWMVIREMLPNALPTLVAEFAVRFCFVILFIASLGFLGLGLRPPNADWGSMVRENSQAIVDGRIEPLAPAFAIALLTISINFVVDWFISTGNRRGGTNA